MSSCTALFLIESLNSLERFLSRLPRSRRKSQRPKYAIKISFSSLGKILVLSKCFWAHPCSLCLLLHLDPNLCDSRLSRDFLIFDLSLSSLPLDLSHVDLVFLVVVVRVMALFIIHVRVRIRIRFCLCESGVVLRLVSINYVVLGDAAIPIHVHQADCHWLSPMVNPFADVWAHVLLELQLSREQALFLDLGTLSFQDVLDDQVQLRCTTFSAESPGNEQLIRNFLKFFL